MGSHLMVGGVQLWSVPIIVMHYCGLAIIWHQNFGNAAKVTVHVYMCLKPGFLLLVRKGFHKSVLAVWQGAHKEPCFHGFACDRIDYAGRVSCPVHLNPLGRLMMNAHGSPAALLILLYVEAELRIHEWLYIAQAAAFHIFSPKEFPIHALAHKFLVDVAQVRQLAG